MIESDRERPDLYKKEAEIFMDVSVLIGKTVGALRPSPPITEQEVVHAHTHSHTHTHTHTNSHTHTHTLTHSHTLTNTLSHTHSNHNVLCCLRGSLKNKNKDSRDPFEMVRFSKVPSSRTL